MSAKLLKSSVREKKVLIVFDAMMIDMINNKKRHPVVTELFVRGKKTLCTFS